MSCDFGSSILFFGSPSDHWNQSHWLSAWPTIAYCNWYWASTTVWIYGLGLICEIFRIFILNPFIIWIHKHKLNIMVIIWMSLSAHGLISPRNTLRNKVHTKCFCPFFLFFRCKRSKNIFSKKRQKTFVFVLKFLV